MKYVYTALLLIALCSSCQDSSNQDYPAIEAEAPKPTVAQLEQQSPADYLKANCTFRKNLIDEWVLEGTIVSSATITKYKDPILTIEYYSETNTKLGAEESTLYKFVSPGETFSFKIKSSQYENATRIAVGVTNATAIEVIPN